MKTTIKIIAILLLVSFASPLAAAESRPLMIAVAANFRGAMEKIVAAYGVETGRKVDTVYSSTGKLYAQITMGAPYDLFLAADAARPELLAEAGLCGESFIYATGEAVLWSKKEGLAVEKRWQEVVSRDDIGKIAISTPETAPYGAAAMTAIARLQLGEALTSKFVYGHNVSQAFQFAFLGNGDIGFTALSLALSDKGQEGTFWRIPEADKVVQKGCAVQGSANRDEVGAFLEFFNRENARAILTELGYE